MVGGYRPLRRPFGRPAAEVAELMPPETDLTVVIVSYNTRAAVLDCVSSVRAANASKVVVVDNGSTDGTVDQLAARFPDVDVIVEPDNPGYGAAANRGAAHCDSDAFLLLNGDTRVDPATIGLLLDYLRDHPDVGVVGPRMIGTDDELQRTTFPFPSTLDVVVGETGLGLLLRRVPIVRDHLLRTWDHSHPRAVPWVVGAALAIRRSAFESVGGFDESFFMYGEEVDLCRRLADRGHLTHYAPVTTVVHIGAASAEQNDHAMQRQRLVSGQRLLRLYETPARRAVHLQLLRMIVALRAARDVAFGLGSPAGSERREAARARWALVREAALWRA
jgi:GT2 family glycosyltransferase